MMPVVWYTLLRKRCRDADDSSGALMDLSGHWIDAVHHREPIRELILDVGSLPAPGSHMSVLRADVGTEYDNDEDVRRSCRAEAIWDMSD